ncbi:MAG: hypothetical protein AB7D96_07635 [Arcobacteraceae bacterium]
MANAVIMTEDQANVIANDLANLISKIEKLNNSNNNDYDELKRAIKQEIRDVISEVRIKDQLKTENFELEDNLNELKKVKSNYATAEKVAFWKIMVAIFVSNLFLVPLAMILCKYLLDYGLIF